MESENKFIQQKEIEEREDMAFEESKASGIVQSFVLIDR